MFKSKTVLNRLMAVLIIMMITFLVIDSDVKQAYALPVPTAPWIPVVIEGGKATAEGVVAVAGGASVGGILAIVLSVIAVGAGAYLIIDNWEEITNSLFHYLDQESLEWFNTIAVNAVYIYDKDRTLGTDLANGVEIDIFNYALPNGQEVSIPSSINDYIKNFVKGYYGYDAFAPGTGSNYRQKIDDIFNVYGINRTNEDNSFYNYSNIVMIRNSPGLYVYATNGTFNMGYTYNGSSYRTTLEGTNVYQWNYDYGSYKSKNLFETLYVYSSSYTSFRPDAGSADLILLSTKNIECNVNGTITIFPAGVQEYTIPPTLYKWNDSPEFVDNNLRLNDLFMSGLADVDLKDIPNTDTLINKIKVVDADARTKKSEIIDKAIVETNEPIPVDTDPTPNPNPDPTQWYDIILNPLKEFARWLFVPDSVVINQLVNDIQNKMDQQAGLLTYPLTLVIRFLMEVYQLDVTDCILHIPKMEIFGYEFYEGCYYNLTQEIHKSDYASIYSVYMYFTDFILIIGFISLCIKKGDEMMKGGISPS